MIVPEARPPEKTASNAPLPISVVPLATPPEETARKAPLLTVVFIAVPPE